MFAIVDAIDAVLAELNWNAEKGRKTWYAARKPKGKRKLYLHRAVAVRAGIAIDGVEIDHKSGDGLDCRRENLRSATRTQNSTNTPRQANNKSGFKGVSWSREKRKWTVQISVNKRRYCLGDFDVVEDAAKAYEDAAARLHGEYRFAAGSAS